ncbi:type II toxin-antitoxin system RelE/ParE family toxin [Campylobacter showae]|nr:type II toxin-antitoxin system RelE/ParE family toxin [Campylobacter showae]
MEIILSEQFKEEIKSILDFYADRSKSNKVANDFLEGLFEKIESLSTFAY